VNSWFTKLRRDLDRQILYKKSRIRFRVSGFEESKYSSLLHFELPVTEIPIWPRTVGSEGDSQPSISTKVRFRVSRCEELKDLTLGHH
jgi:hypothetical protein